MVYEGKYFYIESVWNGRVVEATNEGSSSLTMTKARPRDDGRRATQLWYEDGLNGFIINRRYGTCLDIVGDQQVVMATPVQPNRAEQQWLTTGNRIQDRQNSERVVTLAGSPEDATVAASTATGDVSQAWKFIYQPAEFFYIVSEPSQKVVTMVLADDATGQPCVFIWSRKTLDDSQLWYEDRYALLRSKTRSLVFDSTGKAISMSVFEPGKTEHMWIIAGNKIVKQPNPSKVIGVKDGKTSDGAKLVRASYHGDKAQHWTFEIAKVAN